MTALRILMSALRTAVVHPRIWLTLWLVVTVPALFAVYPVAMQMHAEMGGHPGVSFGLDQGLDADFARLHPEAVVRLTGGLLFALFAFAFLSGGILARVGTDQRFTFTGMLTDGGRLLLRNVRVLLVGAVACAIVFWGVGRLDHLIRHDWVYEWNAGSMSLFGWQSPWLTLELGLEVLSWLWGFLFVALVFVTKMAMARLAVLDRRSALLAWLRAAGTALRHPLRTGMVVVLWTLLWGLGSHLIGILTVHFLEVSHELWLGLAAGQLGVLWTQIAMIAALLAARELALPQPSPVADLGQDESLSPPSEPPVRNETGLEVEDPS